MTHPAASRTHLRVSGLSKSFADPAGADRPPLPVLAEINLEAAHGEFVSIIGPSGCGKSTLFNLIAGLDPPTAGRIELDGRQPGEDLLGSSGYMLQDELLMPWRTVLDNTLLGLEMAGVPRGRAREVARAEIARFGLTGYEQAWPSQLSGGMRRRAALLRTFLTGQDLLLLDEPFVALDALTRQSMQQWLLEIWQQQRKTILFITHDVEEALFLSDRVYVLSARPGRVEFSLEVELPRPRNLDEVTLTPGFIEMKRRLLAPLRVAAAAAAADPAGDGNIDHPGGEAP